MRPSPWLRLTALAGAAGTFAVGFVYLALD